MKLSSSLLRSIVKFCLSSSSLPVNTLSQACVEKLKALIGAGQLSGLLDDRGKFVHITNEEYETVAQFMEKRGRVTLAELVEQGPKLLRFAGTM